MKYGRKNKKGFTLIELLAVIVILAVIALIAVPIIMNVINDSKKGAAKDSMYSYVKAVELAATKDMKPDTDLLSGTYTVKDGNLYTGSTKVLNVDLKGTKPANDGSIKLEKGQVKSADLKFDGYCIGYDGNEAVNKDNCEVAPPTSNPSGAYEIGEVVYFDPTGTVSDCKSGKEWTSSNVSTTCYKWNVIKDNGNNVEMLLDHNTTAKLAWVTEEDYIAAGGTAAEYNPHGNNKYGPITALKQLKTDTTNWTKVEPLSSSDNVTREANSGSKYTINYNGMKARLISGQEVANIVKNTGWTALGTASILTQPWLSQNLNSSIAVEQPYGYWTDTAHPAFTSGVWDVSKTEFNHTDVSYASIFGLRPVVRVLKSNI